MLGSPLGMWLGATFMSPLSCSARVQSLDWWRELSIIHLNPQAKLIGQGVGMQCELNQWDTCPGFFLPPDRRRECLVQGWKMAKEVICSPGSGLGKATCLKKQGVADSTHAPFPWTSAIHFPGSTWWAEDSVGCVPAINISNHGWQMLTPLLRSDHSWERCSRSAGGMDSEKDKIMFKRRYEEKKIKESDI